MPFALAVQQPKNNRRVLHSIQQPLFGVVIPPIGEVLQRPPREARVPQFIEQVPFDPTVVQRHLKGPAVNVPRFVEDGENGEGVFLDHDFSFLGENDFADVEYKAKAFVEIHFADQAVGLVVPRGRERRGPVDFAEEFEVQGVKVVRVDVVGSREGDQGHEDALFVEVVEAIDHELEPRAWIVLGVELHVDHRGFFGDDEHSVQASADLRSQVLIVKIFSTDYFAKKKGIICTKT